MNLITAESAGFCFGVKRAVDQVYEQLEKRESDVSRLPIYTLGPIIHNEEVVHDLQERGVIVAESVEELWGYPKGEGTVIVRAHGVEKGTYEAIQNMGFTMIDATCPFVLKIHRLVEQHSRDGCQIVIVGNENHPEVRGIKSWSSAERTLVIETPEDARLAADDLERYFADRQEGAPSVEQEKKVCIVSQTTFNYNKFQELVEIIEEKGYDIIVLNTICNATEERQTEAKVIAGQVDAMIVIGGRTSSNTQKLFEICENECKNTYYIQTVKDLDFTDFASIDNVGITAGASTPNKIIEEVQKNVRNEF
ncbi:MAG: 4-hydroxy-3-methylbut-2-enyl diphosphate reductase [Roseburia sp.]